MQEMLRASPARNPADRAELCSIKLTGQKYEKKPCETFSSKESVD